MTDETANLILEQLRGIRGAVGSLDGKFEELIKRTGRLETSVAGLRKDIGDLHGMWAELSVRFDGVSMRVGRIEHRLELAEGQ